MRKLIVASVALAVSLSLIAADELPHRAMFGAQLIPSEKGVALGQLSPSAPAATAGLRPGDIVTALGDAKITRPEELAAAVKRHGAGSVEVSFLRDGSPSKLTVQLVEAPRESSPDFDVIYDSVKANDSLRRTIITKPHGRAKRAAVLLAGGIGCYSLEGAAMSPDNSYGALIRDLTANGFVVMRVEKSGMGDSQGVPCPLQDFDNELAGYRAALEKLRTYDFVDARRIFLIGHSLGGIQVPLLAAETPVRGVVAFETAGHKWLDYEERNAKRQMTLEGHSGEELTTRVATRRECLQKLLIERKTPDAVVEAQPQCAEFIQYPADYTYMQQLAAIDPVKEWKKVSAPVLLLYGSSDFITDAEEHELIARAVNSAHKGRAKFIVEKDMDHFMRDVPSQAESMRLMKSEQTETRPLHTQVRKDIIAWLKAHAR